MVTGNLILVNGRPGTAIELSDRGFQFGDGVFTTLLIQDGIPLFAREHLDRLERDAKTLRLPSPDREILTREITQLASGCPSGILKIHWTRGSGGRGYLPPENLAPTRALVLRPTDPISEEVPAPLTVRWAAMRLGINPLLAGAKHMNRLEQVLARLEWSAPEIDEALLLDSEGFVVEGVSTNLFLLHGGIVVTPLLDRAGVRGVMRDLLIKMAAASGYSVREERVSPESLASADALVLTNSLRGISPVASLEGRSYDSQAFATQMHAGYLRELARTRREWL
jgi:4-amino-4-deoxychorismate lyase